MIVLELYGGERILQGDIPNSYDYTHRETEGNWITPAKNQDQPSFPVKADIDIVIFPAEPAS